MTVLLLALSLLLACAAVSEAFKGIEDYSSAPDQGEYTCDELKRWLGSEKHYSHPEKKRTLFAMMEDDTKCKKNPAMMIENVHFGTTTGVKRGYFQGSNVQCETTDDVAVIMLSNFSIKHNFSHFLHSLLRLFCALIDAKLLVWNTSTKKYERAVDFTLWYDENLPLTDVSRKWYNAISIKSRSLREVKRGSCVSAKKVVYGNGCVKLLPPEKWFGYPGCRSMELLPAFGEFFREQFNAQSLKDLIVLDEGTRDSADLGLRVAFAVRDVGHETGKRSISNLGVTQQLLIDQARLKVSYENITFEHLDAPSTVRYMAGTHIFVSVHGAGMTNMFFMNPGTSVVEIIPYPMCDCRSPDFFYGIGGYYHGSSRAAHVSHYAYCVPKEHTKFHTDVKVKMHAEYGPEVKCSWRHLHSVESLTLEPSKFLSFMRAVERDLVIKGIIQLQKPIVTMNPHANG